MIPPVAPQGGCDEEPTQINWYLSRRHASLTLALGNTHIVGSTPGGPDANPLIDEQTFLSVMQQLRPYPD